MATPEVQRLLDVHTSLIFDSKTQKIKCSLTNHQMPAKASAIESYVSGKKYKRLASFNTFAYEEHKEHLVQNRKKENELFCNLTLRHLEKTAKAIQRHITGRKYKNALAKWEECQKTGTTFTPNNQRKAKAPEQTNDDDDDDKKDGDDNKDEGKSDEEEDEDVGSDGTIVEDESTDDEDEDDVVDDDMSDLYPAADFPELNDEDDEEEKENEVEESEDDDEEEEEDEESEEEEVVIKSKKSGAQKRSNKSTNGHEPAQKRPNKSTNGHGPAKKTKIKTRKT